MTKITETNKISYWLFKLICYFSYTILGYKFYSVLPNKDVFELKSNEDFPETFLHELIILRDSTTKFLESVLQKKIRVQIKQQFEDEANNQVQLIRRVILYCNSYEFPLLYCESFMKKSILTSKEYDELIAGNIPIGCIFSSENNISASRKTDIKINRLLNPKICTILNISSKVLIHKQYNFWEGDRFLGEINEFFNEDSLKRI